MSQALAFAAGSLQMALRLSDVEQVLPCQPWRALPLAPEGVVGMVEYRGALLPVVDMRLLLAGTPCEVRGATRLIVVSPVGYRFALLAERVLDVLPLNRLLPGFNLARAPYLGGFMEGEGQPQLVDPAQLLPAALRALYQPVAEPVVGP